MLFRVGQSKTAYIFHIARGEANPLFLHPFARRGAVLKILSKGRIRGLFGTDPDLHAVNLFRNELYEQVNAAVRQWVGDVRFLPRFLYSTASFLVVYIALTLTSRIRLPISVSLGISLVCGLVAYAAVSKRDMRSDAALRKRIALRSEIDRILFEESEFIRTIEQELSAIEAGERPADQGVFRELVELYPAEAHHLHEYLDERVSFGRAGRSRTTGRSRKSRRWWWGAGRFRDVPRNLAKPSWAEVHLRSAGIVGAEESSIDQFLIDVASGEPVSSESFLDLRPNRRGRRRSTDDALEILSTELERAISSTR